MIGRQHVNRWTWRDEVSPAREALIRQLWAERVSRTVWPPGAMRFQIAYRKGIKPDEMTTFEFRRVSLELYGRPVTLTVCEGVVL